MGEKLIQQAAPSTPAATYVDIYPDSGDKMRMRVKDANGIDSAVLGRGAWNYLRNAGFWFAQRQAPGTLTTYSNIGGRIITADGWAISNENASTQYRRVDSIAAVESGLLSRYYGEFTKITSAGKLQIMQAIEAHDIANLRGKNVRLQMKLKSIVAGSAQWNITIIALGSGGSTDVIVTSAGTLFSAQNGSGVDPTLTTNYTYLAPTSGKTGDNCTAGASSYACTVTTSWQRFGGVFTIPTNCKNLIVLIHSNAQVTATNGVAIAEISLTEGEEIQDWAPLDYETELNRVQRYYSKTFQVDTNPATSAGLTTGEFRFPSMVAGAVAIVGQRWEYPVRMRGAGLAGAAPTLTAYNPSAANAQVRDVTSAADCSSTSLNANGEQGLFINTTANAGTVAGECLAVHMTADHEL